MRNVLNYISEKYENLPIYITENGMDEEEDPTSINPKWIDTIRAEFYEDYISAVAQAINEDGVDVRGYFAWSLIDNFEWGHGYTKRFGLVYLDRKKGLTRHPKYSATWFFAFLKQRRRRPLRLSNGNTHANVKRSHDNQFGVTGTHHFGRSMPDELESNNGPQRFARSNIASFSASNEKENIADASEFSDLNGWDRKVKEMMNNNNSEVPKLIN